MNVEITDNDIIDWLFELSQRDREDIIYELFTDGTKTVQEEKNIWKRIKEYMKDEEDEKTSQQDNSDGI